MAVAQRRPDQRIDLRCETLCKIFRLDAVGVERQMQTVLLAIRADRQDRRRTGTDAPRDRVPGHVLDEITFGRNAHALAFQPPVETPVKSPPVTQPCKKPAPRAAAVSGSS